MDRRRPAIFVSVIPDGKHSEVQIDVSHKILDFEYQDCDSKADLCKFSVDNYDCKAYDEPLWKKGNMVIVSWGYEGMMAPTRRCVIDAVKGFNPLKIEAHGLELMMNRASRNRVWRETTYSEIARAIALSWGYGPEMQQIEATTETFDTVTQGRQSDAQFLRRLASKVGFQFYIDFDGFHFHMRRLDQRTHRVYQYFTDPGRGDILDIDLENDITAKPGRVGTRGRNPNTRKNTGTDALPPGTPTVQVADELMPGYSEAEARGESVSGVTVHVDTNNMAAVPEAIAAKMSSAADRAEQVAAQLEAQAAAAEGTYSTETGADVGEEMRQMAEQARQTANGIRAAANIESIYIPPDGSSTQVVYGGNYDDRGVSERERDQREAAAQDVINYMLTHPDEVRPFTVGTDDPSSRSAGARTERTASETQEGATTQAVAAHRRTQLMTVQMKLTILGDPTLLAKSVVEVRGVGRRLSGPYYVSEVSHKIGGSYTCALKMRSDGTAGYGDPAFPEVVAPRPTVRDPQPGSTPGAVAPGGDLVPGAAGTPGAVVGQTYRDPTTGEEFKVLYADEQGRAMVIEQGQADPWAPPDGVEYLRSQQEAQSFDEWEENFQKAWAASGNGIPSFMPGGATPRAPGTEEIDQAYIDAYNEALAARQAAEAPPVPEEGDP